MTDGGPGETPLTLKSIGDGEDKLEQVRVRSRVKKACLRGYLLVFNLYSPPPSSSLLGF